MKHGFGRALEQEGINLIQVLPHVCHVRGMASCPHALYGGFFVGSGAVATT